MWLEEFEDIKEVIRSRISKKQTTQLPKKGQKDNNDLPNIHIKQLKKGLTRTPLKTGGAHEW